MSLKLRSILVLVIGTSLGLTVSIGSSMFAGREAEPAAANDVLEDEYLALLAEAMQRVRYEYVDRIDDKTLVENAIKGMLEGLDQHSRYLDSEQYEDIRIATTGNYTGVGLEVRLEKGKVTVVEPLDDAPAARAGIRPGDIVVSIDDIPIGKDSVADAVDRMQGEPGTEVRLGVSRGPSQELLSFSLTRAEIHVNSVRSELLDDGYAYVRLSGFSDSTVDELKAAADRLSETADGALKGLVLDLRDNPGGVLEAAIGVADVFLDDGLIVRGNGRISQARFEQYASPGDPLETIPLAVLINSGSASGSEIVAGALKDHDRGPLVGHKTYGKGSVQSVVPLGTGSALKLTTAHYVTPAGAIINGQGIEPDIVVGNADPRRQYRGPGSETDVADDFQLQEALRSLGYEPLALSSAR